MLQLICFDTFDTPKKIFDTFDFTVCMGCYDFKKEKFVLHSDFLKHNSQRILMFNDKTRFPIVSALRVDKYKQKDYTISKTEYLRIILTCMDLHIDNYEDLKEQLGGMYGVNGDPGTATGYYCPYELNDKCPQDTDDCEKCKYVETVFEDEVDSIYISECGIEVYTKLCGVLDSIGKSVFLTKEETEQALAERQGR